jgi:uncharacterized repeat protein (TIGR01451 family)
MKKQLLIIFAFLLFTGNVFSQVTAFDVPDLQQCNNEVFNLSAQNTTVLGNQDPDATLISYYTTLANAVAGTQRITNPSAYVASGLTQTIYIRVQDYFDGSFDTTSFTISWNYAFAVHRSNVSVCTSYTLPALTSNNRYYTAPNGQGNQIAAGTVITASITLYIYVSNGFCSDESSFTITVGNYNVPDMPNVTACSQYNLPALSNGNYYNSPGGAGVPVPVGSTITSSRTLYIYAQDGTCNDQSSFTITIVPPPPLAPVSNQQACTSYILPALTVGNYYTAPGGPAGVGTALFAGDAITQTATIYVYAASAGATCFSERQFTVSITSSTNIPLNPLEVCDENQDLLGLFDLTSAETQIRQVLPNAVTTYYASLASAQANTNPIVNPTSYSSTSGMVYIGINNGSCYFVLLLNVNVINCTGNEISGTVTYDYNVNGCDAADYPAANVQVSYTNGNATYNTFTNANGNYTFVNVPDGPTNVYVQPIGVEGATITPALINVTMPGSATATNFCLTAPAVTDISVQLWPSGGAVPGFVSSYTIYLNNNGYVTTNGTVTLQYDISKLTYLPSAGSGITQAGNTLTFSYSNLYALSSQFKGVSFTVAQPPVANQGDVLTFTANITPQLGDATPYDNTYVYNQTVVNSYDPNDITVDKETINMAQAGGYLYYTIRFQNMGTANATNVKVLTQLDANLDWSTFKPVGASHNYVANRTNAGVEFLFNNIQLPFESANEPASHGSITYKIKPNATVQIGDTMNAVAGIYFDFNEAIITNTATTTVTAVAGLNTVNAKGFVLYPNPATGTVTLQLSNNIISNNAEVTITDILGKTVGHQNIAETNATINIASLKSGIYFVNLKTNGTQLTQKLIVN